MKSEEDFVKNLSLKSSSKTSSKIPPKSNKLIPTIYLPISPAAVEEKLAAGKFRKLPELTPIPVEKFAIGFNEILGKDQNDESFSFQDNNGDMVVIHTTNHQQFCYYDENGVPQKGGMCQWYRCKKTIENEPIGIPIKMENVITANNPPKEIKIFHVVGEFCCYRHAFNHLGMINSQADWQFKNSYNLLLSLHAYKNSTEKIEKPLDSQLFYPNVKDEELPFYEKTYNIITLPSKLEFVRRIAKNTTRKK